MLESQGFYHQPMLGPRSGVLWPLLKGVGFVTLGLVLDGSGFVRRSKLFAGNVAEVAVYDYALDPPCIAKHFALGNPQ